MLHDDIVIGKIVFFKHGIHSVMIWRSPVYNKVLTETKQQQKH